MSRERKTQAWLDKLIEEGRIDPTRVVGVRLPDMEPAPVDDKVTEKQFQSEVVKHAKRQGFRVYHTFDSRRSEKGFPDLVMIRCGRLIVAELKTEKGVLSAEQSNWIELFIECGVEAFVWRPSNWPEIIEKLAA